MRPRKIIALFCSDFAEYSALRVALYVRGYKIWNGEPEQPALCLILHHGERSVGKMACLAFPGVRLIAVLRGDTAIDGVDFPAARVLRDPTMSELLEAIRILAARRAPKRNEISS